MKSKKAAIANIQGIIITLVIVGILLGIGFLVLEELRDQDSLIDSVGTVVNETGIVINQTIHTISSESIGMPAFNTFAVTICVCNHTGVSDSQPSCVTNTTITSTKYTVNATGGTLISAQGGAENYTDAMCTYTYHYGETSYTAINETIEAMNEIPDWLAIIVIIAIVGILLAIVFAVLPRAGGGEYGESSGFAGGEAGITAEI